MIYDDFSERAQKVLRYCTTCPKMCRFACPVAHEEARETVTPWGLVSLLYEASGDGPVAFDEQLAGLLNHCTGCLRCQSACLHDNHVPRTLFEGRAAARARGLMPGDEPSRCGEAEPGLELDGVALGFSPDSDVAFFPSCSGRRADGAHLRRMAAVLAGAGLEVTLEATAWDCCGYPMLSGGLDGLFRDRAAQLGRALSRYERVVTDCDELVAISRTAGWRDDLDDGGAPTIVHWTEALAEALGDLETAPRQAPPGNQGVPYYHDGCRLGRGAGVYDAPRALLRWAVGEPGELADCREMAWCCGAGAGYERHEPRRAAEIAATLLEGLPEGATLVTSRPACVSWMANQAPGRVRTLFEVIADAMGVE